MGILNWFNVPKDVADTYNTFLTSAILTADFLERFTPKIEDEVIVEVIGQPGSTKQQLYWLALSTAYGLARPRSVNTFLSAPPELLMVEYDASDNWVRVTLKYKVGITQMIMNPYGGSAGIGTAIASQLRNPGDIPLIYGPPDEVKGIAPALPFTFFSLPFPFELPFTGKQILTAHMTTPDPDPTQYRGQTPPEISSPNPKPSGDNRSRGSAANPLRAGNPGIGGSAGTIDPNNIVNYLIPMVFAALTDPGSQTLAAFEFPVSGPQGG